VAGIHDVEITFRKTYEIPNRHGRFLVFQYDKNDAFAGGKFGIDSRFEVFILSISGDGRKE
jgi:hypothetical protein